MSYVDIQRLAIDENAGDLRDHIARLEVEVSGFDDGKAGEQRFAFDQGQAVCPRLLDQIVVDVLRRPIFRCNPRAVCRTMLTSLSAMMSGLRVFIPSTTRRLRSSHRL